jgi:PAS domain S-box-containing protein
MSQRAPLVRYLPFACAVSAGLLLSAVAFVLVSNQERERIRAEFEHKARGHASAIRDRVHQYHDALHSIVGLYAASREVDRQEFREFVARTLSRLPGIQALIWAPRVQHPLRPAHEAAARKDGYRNYRVTERDARGDVVSAVRREVHFPIYYAEPPEGNEPLMGLDLASDAVAWRAMERARDTGAGAATGRIALPVATGDKSGILVAVPMYRKGRPHQSVEQRRESLQGFAVGLFRTGDVVVAALGDVPTAGLDVYLYDRSAGDGQDRLLYVHPSRLRKGPPSPNGDVEPKIPAGLTWGMAFDVAGRQWSLRFYPAPEFLAAHGTWQAWGVLVAGLVVTAMLGGYLLIALGRAARVERLVKERTVELATANQDLARQIEERDRAEEALKESEERYRTLMEESADAVIVYDARGHVTYLNPAFQRTFGWSQEELLGKRIEFVPEENRQETKNAIERLRRGEQVVGFETRRRTKQGVLLDVLVSASPLQDADGRYAGAAVTFRDISERKRAEDILTRRTRQLQALREVAVEITRELDLNRLLAVIVRRATELFGASAGAVWLWDEDADVLHPAAWHGLEDWIRDVRVRLGEGLAGMVAKHREGMITNDYQSWPYASPLFLERTSLTAIMGEPLLYRDRLVGVIVVAQTATSFSDQDRETLSLFAAQAAIAIENAQLYAELASSAKRLEELYNVGLAMQEPLALEQRLTLILKGAQSVLGFDRINILLPDDEGLMLRAVASVGVDEPLEEIRAPIGREGGAIAKAFLERQELVWAGEGRVPEDWQLAYPYSEIRAFRSRAFVNLPLIVRGESIGVVGADNKISRRPITQETVRLLKTFGAQAALAIDSARLYEEVKGLASVLERKVEERTRALKEAQVQLIQSGKLAAVGTLAAGVAHELNQPLMVIRGYAQELLADPRLADEELREDLHRIEAQTTRMGAIINHLRDFSRQSKGKRQETDLSQVVTQALTFLGQQLKTRNVEVVQELDPALPAVWADPLQIEQVLLNLITNARDAMEKTGKGTITIRTGVAGDGRITLSVTDTGTGIAPDLQARIFDPFFTTKEIGKGTGLGLSICHGIMEEHGGEILVQSPVVQDRGTCFTLVLPRSLRGSGEGDRA